MVNNNAKDDREYVLGRGGRSRRQNPQDRTHVGPRGPLPTTSSRSWDSQLRTPRSIMSVPARRDSSSRNMSSKSQPPVHTTQPSSNKVTGATSEQQSASQNIRATQPAKESHPEPEPEQPSGNSAPTKASDADQAVDEPRATDSQLSLQPQLHVTEIGKDSYRVVATTNLGDGVDQLIHQCRQRWGNSTKVQFNLSIGIDEPIVQCGNCKEFGHSVIECRNSRGGVIHGCACCNSSDHATEKCKNFPPIPQSQVELIVKRRGHMAPLASPEWYPILYEAVANNTTHAHNGPLPWTKEHSLAIEKTPGSSALHFDPYTRDWSTTKLRYGGIPSSLHAALSLEAAYRSEHNPTRTNLRPSRIVRFNLNRVEMERLEKSKAILKSS